MVRRPRGPQAVEGRTVVGWQNTNRPRSSHARRGTRRAKMIDVKANERQPPGEPLTPSGETLNIVWITLVIGLDLDSCHFSHERR